MKNEQQIFTASQANLVAELVETYGVKSDDITFFSGETEPFLGYEAQSALANTLTDIRDIDTDIVPSISPDTVTIKCRLELDGGFHRSGIGVVNSGETDGRGEQLTQQQILYTATSRALRSALRAASIDLIWLHANRNSPRSEQQYSGEPISNFDKLIKQVHALGVEAGLIAGKDKTLWRSFLINRYQRAHSNELAEEELADLAAALKTWQPLKKAA